MKTRLYLAVLAMTALFVLALWVNRRSTNPSPTIPHPPAIAPAIESPPVEPPTGGAVTVPGNSAVSPALAAGTPATPAVRTEMETVKFFIRDFRAALGENPVGNNAEITKALMGANQRKTKFALPGDSHVNEAGELVDSWGTPYFFHALSAREMEIHSAGPDKRMWTIDDIVIR